MGKTAHRLGSLALALALFGLCLGCAGRLAASLRYEYFAQPAPDDAWSRKIRLWQARERDDRQQAQRDGLAPVAGARDGADDAAGPATGSDLRAKYQAFRVERRRAMARELAEWIQSQAREHYRPDGPIDHWATLEETFAHNGDDCDGLELLTYHLLRDLGFDDDEVFRAIVFRPRDGQHHMVTLWFEDADDPWVIDPTGAMTSGMPRMSAVPGWTPLKIFTEDVDYTVEPGVAADRLASN